MQDTRIDNFTAADRLIAAHDGDVALLYIYRKRTGCCDLEQAGAHLPVELIYFERFSTKNEAMRREAEIKRLTRSQKLELLQRQAPSGIRPEHGSGSPVLNNESRKCDQGRSDSADADQEPVRI